MKTVRLKDRTVWITGASSGIGRGLAQSLIKAGNKVIVTARNTRALRELQILAPNRVSVISADIADPNCIPSLKQDLLGVTDSIDTVILNAGTCEYLDIESFESALVDRVIQVNLLGMSRCVEACIDLLKLSDNHPHLVGVSSAAAITGLPRAEAYGASKAAVGLFLESLALDLHQYGIDVSTVYPGFVDTPLTRKNDFYMPFLMNSEDAVRKVIHGIEKRKHKIRFPRSLTWLLITMSALPEALRFRIGLAMVQNRETSTR